MNFDLTHYLRAHNAWSARTFPKQTPLSVINHIRNELDEIRRKPRDIIEWIDVAILAFDGAYVTGHAPRHVIYALQGPLSRPRPWRPTADILREIERELLVLERLPFLISRWANIATLAFQGAFQQGYTTDQVLFALQHKQSVNFGRTWPTPGDPMEPTEHVRTEES